MSRSESRQRTFLIACLQAALDSDREARVEEAAKKVADWSGIERLAEIHSVAPIVYSQIRSLDLPLPRPQKRALGALELRHRYAYAVQSACLEDILRSLEARSIGVLVLKGAALAHLVYAEPALRPMRDLDILVDRECLVAAREALLGLGYSFAENHRSRYMGGHHHLPEAGKVVDGMRISVEIHHDALSPDSPTSITLPNLAEEPRRFIPDHGMEMSTLGHVDMLRHLCRHTFEPAVETRLIHLMDLVAYGDRFAGEIYWPSLNARYPEVINTLSCAHCVLNFPDRLAAFLPPPSSTAISGLGRGMKPLSEILRRGRRPSHLLRDLFNPPAWWLHAYYGVHPDDSVAWVRAARHPATVSRWLARRAIAGFSSSREGL